MPAQIIQHQLPNSEAADWATVIFASRETVSILMQSLQAAMQSAIRHKLIDVLVNGNLCLADQLAERLQIEPLQSKGVLVRVWSIEAGDKGNAWNQYIQHVWAGESLVFFMDGYVRPNPDAIALLGNATAANADALGGTGVPSMGRTAQALRSEMAVYGGFHGNFCCIKGAVIADMRQLGIKLPLGLYRVDSTMGSLLSFGLHPQTNAWEPKRIEVHQDASWATDPKHWWRFNDVKAKIKRHMRQKKGAFENKAVSDLFYTQKMPATSLPQSAAELVLAWVQRCPAEAKRLIGFNYFAHKALVEFSQYRAPPPNQLVPKLNCSNISPSCP